jgi:26S proteasome regulatory subunit N4
MQTDHLLHRRQELRNQLDLFLAQRTALEVEAAAIHTELTSPGINDEPPAGIKDSLIDQEGFPRNDIDIFAVRVKRKRLAEINYDYKQLMKQMEEITQTLFSLGPSREIIESPSTEAKVKSDGNNSASVTSSSSVTINPKELRPIAILDEVFLDSPAYQAGIRNQDQLICFGEITYTTTNYLQAIAQLVGQSVQRPISVIIRRTSASTSSSSSATANWSSNNASSTTIEEDIQVVLTPRPWGGRGLLGCHLTPIK